MTLRETRARLKRYKLLVEVMPDRFATVHDVVRRMANRGHLDEDKRRQQLTEWHERRAAKRARAVVEARKIPVVVRREVLASGLCTYCEVGKAIIVDHIVPVSRGGSRRRSNLTPACEKCNDEKGDVTPVEWRAWRIAHGRRWPPLWPHDARKLYYGLLDMMDPETRSMVREQWERMILKIQTGEVELDAAALSEPLDPELARYTAA